jgi:putative membrane protein
MSSVAKLMVWLAALVQLAFMIAEMGLWERYVAPKVAGYDPEVARITKPLGSNIGLYNGLLAAGLIASLYLPLQAGAWLAFYLAIFLLVAGVYGGVTVKKTIGIVQGGAGLLLLLALLAQSKVFAGG